MTSKYIENPKSASIVEFVSFHLWNLTHAAFLQFSRHEIGLVGTCEPSFEQPQANEKGIVKISLMFHKSFITKVSKWSWVDIYIIYIHKRWVSFS